ncbi:MAG TPA: DUF6600 domain-containing protein, partial [Gemmatimonadales bacterium]|nr:DUF6600 domain-containing protein [Gemmatimonadales bacterium]
MKNKRPSVASTTLLALLGATCLMPATGFLAATPAMAQQAQITVSTFYEALAPHGRWVRHPSFRYIWCPSVPAGWTPYSSGRWVLTDRYGWTFVSDDPYGWAVYHYGRWFVQANVGWCWVPGTVWAPAWVSWRRAPDFVGWAPLPPARPGIQIDIDVNINIEQPEDHWVFVPTPQFLAPDLITVAVPPAERPVIFNQTNIVGPVTVQNNTIINNVIEVNYIEQATGQTVQPRPVEPVADPAAVAQAGAAAAAEAGPIPV